MIIKTRFAPSPTGYLHIGGVRTALYSWLFARNQGGKFILRIEDTNTDNYKKTAIDNIIEGMNWLNLDWDEGPYFQTKRINRYNIIIDRMLKEGKAYKCYCSKERLDNIRKKQIINKEKPRYDNYCRNNNNFYKKNEPFVVRFRNPKEGFVIFNDKIRGLIKFSNTELDDLIIRRTDGFPTYNFCVVIDDLDMKITHVIRGEDHINNTPRQINILKALNAPIPEYAHLSLLKDKNGKKISKSNGDIGIMKYREDGILPDALLNYLIRLGWSYGNKEIFSKEEMIKLFNLKSFVKSSSIFNKDKLLWLNHYYINNLSNEYVATHLNWHIKNKNIDISIGPKLSLIVKILGKSCKTLKEMAKNCEFFYKEKIDYNNEIIYKYFDYSSIESLEQIKFVFKKIKKWTIEEINKNLLNIANKLNFLDLSKINMQLRIAITGSNKSPKLDIILHAIGQYRTIQRISQVLDFIKKNKLL